MPSIPNNYYFAYSGTHASVAGLSGLSRATTLDTYYVKQSASGDGDLTTVSGNANHTHSDTAHTHTTSSDTLDVTPGWDNSPASATQIDTHNHPSTNSTSDNISLTGTATNDLSTVTVIWLKSDGTPTEFPDNAVCAFLSDTLPSDWARVAGNAYMKGAAAAADASLTPSGSSTHNHTASGSHDHATTTSGAANTTATDNIDPNPNNQLFSGQTHTHTVTLTGTTPTIDNTSPEPVFRKVNIIEYTAGTNNFPDKICCWVELTSHIATDWARVTNFDGDFYKGANADSESDSSTGGSTTHVHTQSHTHSGSSSGSSSQCGNDTDVLQARRGGSGTVCNHAHTWTIGSNSTDITASASEAHYPQYKELIMVEYTDPAAGGAAQSISVMTT